MNLKNLTTISLILFWFETQIIIIASKRFEIVGRNKIPNKTPYSTVDVKFEQHCFSKCHHVITCFSFLVQRTSNAMPIRCHFYNSTTTGLTDSQATEDNTILYTAQIQDCLDLYNSGHKSSGVYSINLLGKGQRDIRCDMEIEGGGWTVILYRTTSQHNWNVGWNQYKNGIGEITGDFYLGNELVHQITDSGQYELYFRTQIEVANSPANADNTYFGWHGNFHVANEADYYRLTVGDIKPGSQPQINDLNGMQFTTKDVKRDNHHHNCASFKLSAFWWDGCGRIQPFGPYLHSDSQKCMGINVSGVGRLCTLNFQMLVRRK
uniref:Fibrinogen C-terminal domain-containing protein n=2 Tax=Clytia hemisphaerica TaxID=252671 RepID=A0A7M5XEM1_9CNID